VARGPAEAQAVAVLVAAPRAAVAAALVVALAQAVAVLVAAPPASEGPPAAL